MLDQERFRCLKSWLVFNVCYHRSIRQHEVFLLVSSRSGLLFRIWLSEHALHRKADGDVTNRYLTNKLVFSQARNQ